MITKWWSKIVRWVVSIDARAFERSMAAPLPGAQASAQAGSPRHGSGVRAKIYRASTFAERGGAIAVACEFGEREGPIIAESERQHARLGFLWNGFYNKGNHAKYGPIRHAYDDDPDGAQSVDVSSWSTRDPSQNAPKTIFDYPIVHRLFTQRIPDGSTIKTEVWAIRWRATTPTSSQPSNSVDRRTTRTTDPAADPNYESTQVDHYALWLRRSASMRTRFAASIKPFDLRAAADPLIETT